MGEIEDVTRAPFSPLTELLGRCELCERQLQNYTCELRHVEGRVVAKEEYFALRNKLLFSCNLCSAWVRACGNVVHSVGGKLN
jgi:hypothetical protein